MSVQEIKSVIAQLPSNDLIDFARWFEEFQQGKRNREITSEAGTTSQNPRTAGLHIGSAWISEDFDQPLPEEFWTGAA